MRFTFPNAHWVACPSMTVGCCALFLQGKPHQPCAVGVQHPSSVCGKWILGCRAGMYPVTLTFTDSYPSKPPACHLPERFFHPKCVRGCADATCWLALTQKSNNPTLSALSGPRCVTGLHGVACMVSHARQ